MFVIAALPALLTFLYLRPQEVFEALRPVTIFWILGPLAFFYALDLRLGFTRLRSSPVLNTLLGLLILAIATVAIKSPDRLGEKLTFLATSMLSFLFVCQGAQSLRGLSATAAVLLVMTLIMAAIGVEQGLSSSVCFRRGVASATSPGDINEERPCLTPDQCQEGGVPGADYLCEKPGLLATHSIGQRVRFRGRLEDPNELAMAICMGVPLAFAFYERRRNPRRLAMVLATLALAFVCLVMTKSRSGQLSMLAVLGIYFLRKFGKRGAIIAAAAAVPLMLLGGRSGAEAESSSEERLQCWNEALEMWRSSPLIGVGQGQFLEYHYLTAHNSFLLAIAELGPIGLFLFTAVLYAAVKTVLRIQIDLAPREEAKDARIWATALLASLAGMIVSAFFLSITYHPIFWLFLALPAALYGAVRSHDPEFRVTFTWRDAGIVAGIDAALILAVMLYLRLKGV